MAKDIVMPALGMAQETGTLLQWLKAPGDTVTKGEPLMEIETDKTTAEVEAPVSGVLANVTAQPGDVIPVGQTIAVILTPGEAATQSNGAPAAIEATPIARRVADEHNLDLSRVKPQGGRVQKEDVLTYLAASRRTLASPKARRLAQERKIDLKAILGSGPGGAVLAADVLAMSTSATELLVTDDAKTANVTIPPAATDTMAISRIWRVMAERVSKAWTSIPHFYVMREVNAAHLVEWLSDARDHVAEKITYTDLLIKLTAAALRQHPRLNASWRSEAIMLNQGIHIGLAVAVEDGLVVPVVHHADTLGLQQLSERRSELVAKAQAGNLTLNDLSGGTFTISNLGMYGVDAFNAIINPPQAAILAVSRIADRVIALNGQPAVQAMLTLTLSCDHRVVDGARGAQFLQTLTELIENPMRLLD